MADSKWIKEKFVLSQSQQEHWRVCVCVRADGSRVTQINNGTCTQRNVEEGVTTLTLIHTVMENCSGLSRSSFYTYLTKLYNRSGLCVSLYLLFFFCLFYLWLFNLSLTLQGWCKNEFLSSQCKGHAFSPSLFPLFGQVSDNEDRLFKH